MSGYLPWVPEPQNLNEKKLVRGKERRKKGATFFPSSFFLFIIFGSVPREAATVQESWNEQLLCRSHGMSSYCAGAME